MFIIFFFKSYCFFKLERVITMPRVASNGLPASASEKNNIKKINYISW